MVDDQYRGQAGRCVTCDGQIQIPNFSVNSTSKRPRRSRPLAWALASVVAITFAVVASYLLFKHGSQTFTQLQTSRERIGSMRNLEKIALALNAYAADHGQYPPAILRDASGKPLHSWRVLLLPYLGEEDLYNEFRRDLPWDTPENTIVATQSCPSVYQHPNSQMMGLSNTASYYLVTGAGTLFPPDRSLSPGDVQDDASQTILVVEASPTVSSDNWTDPIDLDFALMRGDLTSPGGNELGGWVDGGAAVATVDGRAHFIDDSTPPLVVRALITPRGNEVLPDDTVD
jgi:hypothetical protein